jgi:ATP-binding cassette subfamily B protein
LFARNLTNPINQLVASFGSFLLALASAERVLEITDQQSEQDKPDAKDLPELYGLVEAIDMNFGYTKDNLVLRDINFVAQPGTKVALVGPTGAGKTTIVNLITKFYDITSGKLLIDGMDIADIKRENLRKYITMVLQDTYLFSVSIFDNIRYGRLDATREEVINAAKIANADHFINLLPKGYDTILEDNGSNLSQGQRQLLAIARAFLANSRIVILDEATSSIDTKTEMHIQKAMEKLIEGRTSFIIAHRLSTIRDADKILVMGNGDIVETGKHKELLAMDGTYADIYNSQFAQRSA